MGPDLGDNFKREFSLCLVKSTPNFSSLKASTEHIESKRNGGVGGVHKMLDLCELMESIKQTWNVDTQPNYPDITIIIIIIIFFLLRIDHGIILPVQWPDK